MKNVYKAILSYCIAGAALLLLAVPASAQMKIGNNPTQINKSSILELESDRQGLLLTRLTDTTEINNLTPPAGMIIYLSKTPNQGLYLRTPGGYWEKLANANSVADNWSIDGNAGTDSTKNFIGTTDEQALSTKLTFA